MWRISVDKMFNVTYWPYVQVTTAYSCVSMFFADSYFNLILKNALLLSAVSSFIILGA